MPDSSAEQISPSTKTACECGDGSGFVPMLVNVNGRERRRLRYCSCRATKKIDAALPARYRKASLDDFRPGAQEQIWQWFRSPGDGLFLSGKPGTGKTHLAAAIFTTAAKKKDSVNFFRATQLFQKIRDNYQSEETSEEEILRDFTRPRILILDDLGAGSLSDHERRYTLEVLDRRINEEKPTVITSNWSLEQIEDKLDERIASRISGFKIIDFNGEDRRGNHGR